jgi:hypothetical protein
MAAELFEKVGTPAIAVGRIAGFDQSLFGGTEHALKVDEEFVVDEMGVDILRPATHEFLLKSGDQVADCRLNLSLRLGCLSDHRATPFRGQPLPKTAKHPHLRGDSQTGFGCWIHPS